MVLDWWENYLFIGCLQAHAGEEDHKDDYDADGQDASCDGGVLIVSVVAEEVAVGEEVQGLEEFF